MPVALIPSVCTRPSEFVVSKNQEGGTMYSATYCHSKIPDIRHSASANHFMIEGKRKTKAFVLSIQCKKLHSFFVHFPFPFPSLESTIYNHRRVLSGQAIFKRIYVCVCVILAPMKKKKNNQ